MLTLEKHPIPFAKLPFAGYGIIYDKDLAKLEKDKYLLEVFVYPSIVRYRISVKDSRNPLEYAYILPDNRIDCDADRDMNVFHNILNILQPRDIKVYKV